MQRPLHKRKGGQVRFSNDQTIELEKKFETQKYLSPPERKRLAKVLQLSERQEIRPFDIQRWIILIFGRIVMGTKPMQLEGITVLLGSLKYSGDDYRLLGVDLSRLAQLEGALRGAGLDPAAPTLILAEMVLPYMEVERSDALIQWAAGHFLKAWFILYEQIHPSDPFGRIMQNHFSRLQSPLRSLTSYPDCKAQQMRFLQRGWTECHIMDMNEFYRSFVPGEEQKRIQALEPFDEFEEWHLKCSHYFILAASKGEDSSAPPVFPRVEDGRLFHTVNVLRSGWAVVLGGRKSPVSLALPPLRLKGLADADPFSPSNPVLELTPLPPVEGLSVPRWRHTATEVTHEGQAYLFIYGGCSSGQLVLTDWHFLHLEGLRCQQIPVEGPVPAGRHSHSACSWAGGVLIAGGLASSEQLLGSLLLLKPAGRGFRWHSLETCPPLTPRYSHTAHVHRGKLLLVGGVWLNPPSVPGVAVIDLATRALAEYHIDTTFLEWPLMLHNHSSVIIPDTEEMILTGGGGNCFSFGTHLNWSPIRLDLSSI
ncbi:PREDICTED: tRNA wybutosine-synthesizing protein 4 [Thamnophis sirtalis]|uniref:tRNA wybutosine-synthesizing protein 4 n=1 Tax=Thamnophis sirtalis TaxID=35019 RepID=A0A6I9Y586_9SAUR|nr:PREDICTED: tRNA wybutosine-synthesizing protein 4 [Thamnophis sirtalis]